MDEIPSKCTLPDCTGQTEAIGAGVVLQIAYLSGIS